VDRCLLVTRPVLVLNLVFVALHLGIVGIRQITAVLVTVMMEPVLVAVPHLQRLLAQHNLVSLVLVVSII
jgi:hypothetical protein